MLRVSATACSLSRSTPSKTSVVFTVRAALRGLSRPLSLACRSSAHASSISSSSSRVRFTHSATCSSSQPERSCSAMSHSSAPTLSPMAPIALAADRSRIGGHTSRFTTSPTAMPIAVS